MDKKTNLTRNLSCILNPQAANKKWMRRKKLRNYLQKKLQSQIHGTLGEKENTIELARKLSLDSEMIVAIGGDGTIADILQGIFESQREKEVCLGIIPLGSGNAFRKSLHIPKNVKKAVRLLNRGKPRKIDLIDLEGKVAGFVSIGATAKVTQKKLQGKIQGMLGHLMAGRMLFTLSQKEQEIELIDGLDDSGNHFDQKKFKLKFLDCVVAKTNYFGYSWRIAPRAKADDSYLDVTFFQVSGFKYVLNFPFIYFGLFQKTQKHYKAKKVIIRGKDLPVQYNGEFLGVRDQVELRVMPEALRIICPREK